MVELVASDDDLAKRLHESVVTTALFQRPAHSNQVCGRVATGSNAGEAEVLPLISAGRCVRSATSE